MINVIGPINNLSYGTVTKNIVEYLERSGVMVSLTPLDVSCPVTPIVQRAMDRTNPKTDKFIEFEKSPSIRVWHAHDMSIFNGYPHIAFPIFELDTFAPQEKKHLKFCDKVFVTSQWGKSVLINNGIEEENISIIPLGVTEDYKPNPSIKKPEKITFMNIGKWEVRKGHDVLHYAFAEAFKDNNNVSLWMSCNNPFYDCSDWERQYRQELGDKVQFLPWMEQKQLIEVMNMADVGVFPYRAEGWNFGLHEMMACGADVIATNYSAPTDYINEDNAILIEPNGMEPANDGVWFHGQGDWCTYKFEDLVERLKESYERAIGRRKNRTRNEAGIRVGREFGWFNTTNSIRRAVGQN